MRQKIFAIMGATGQIGHVVAEDLLKRGHIVRAIGRDPKKLHKLDTKGCNLVITDFDDAEILTQAFKDCFAVFSFIPPSYSDKSYSEYQDRVSRAIVQAVRDSGVTHVVNLSSVGGELPSGTGPIIELHRHEERLNALDNLTSLIHLRPNFFMENCNSFLPMIQNEHVIRSPLDADLPIPMVATRDIGWKASDFLDSTGISGRLVFDFVGPKEVTMNEVAELFAYYFQIPELHYEQVSFEQAKNGMLAAGTMHEELVDMLLEMYKGFNDGLIKPTQELKPSHHGTTTFETYVQQLTHTLFALWA